MNQKNKLPSGYSEFLLIGKKPEYIELAGRVSVKGRESIL